MQDNEDSEVFYYSTPADFAALEKRLTTQTMRSVNHE
jgi:hypothetical protein